MVAPAPNISIDLLGPRLSAWDLVEETAVTIDGRSGWAPPRRRPRRVYRKLAQRQFRLRCGEGSQYTSRMVGPKVAPALQLRVTRHTAPRLAVWLAAGREQDEPLRITVAPLMYDGNSATAEMTSMRPLPAGWERHRTIRVPVFASLAVADSHSCLHSSYMHSLSKTFEAIDLVLSMKIGDLSAWGVRYLHTRLTVYAAQGVSEMIIRTADKRCGSELARVYEQHVGAVGQAVMGAAAGITGSKVIAQQTSYRPKNRK